MANERVRGNDIGATGLTVGANISRARKGQQLSLQELEDRLNTLGRRISFSGLSKIERGERRVDTDDLMAIALALDTSPVALLLPLAEPSEIVEVTGAAGSAGVFWQWAMGEETYISRDTRAFVARSLPWWLDSQSLITWYGDLDLLFAVGDAEPKLVERHQFTARERGQVDWTRGDDGVRFPGLDPDPSDG